MALDPQKWMESLPDQIRSQIQSDVTSAPDPTGYMRRLTNVGWIAERDNVPGKVVAQNYETFMRSHAEKNGWGDVWQNEATFHARVTNDAARERDKRVAREGLPDNTEEAAAAREKSLRNRAYWSAAEGDDVADDLDMVKGYAAWQKDAITGKSFDVNDSVNNYREWVEIYRLGQADLRKAREVAAKALPILQSSGDTGGGSLGRVLKEFRGLTPQQTQLAFKQLSVLQDETKSESVLSGMGTLKQSVVAAGRSLRNIGLSAEESAMKERLAEGGFREGERVMPLIYNSLLKEGDAVVPENVGDFQSWPTLTAEQADLLNKTKADRAADMETAFRLRNFAQESLNPLRRDTIPEMATITLAESLPAMALTAVPGGLGFTVLQNNYAYESENKLIQQGVPREKAKILSEFIGAGQVAMDVISLGLLKKAPGLGGVFQYTGIPAVTRWVGNRVGSNAVTRGAAAAGGFIASNTANVPAQLGLRLAGTTVGETFQEIGQDILVEATVLEVGNWFDKTLPDVDWRGVKDQMVEAGPETMFSMMLMSLIGAGVATRTDIKNIELLSQDTRAMELLGIPQERIQQIQAGGDAFALFQAGFRERQAAALAGKPVPDPKARPKSESVRLLKEAWEDRAITEKGDSAARGIGASYEWAQKTLEQKAEIAARVAPVVAEEDGLFTVEQPDGAPDVVLENAEEAVAASIAAFEAKVLNPALEAEEVQDAEAEGRLDLTNLDADPPVTTDSILTRDEESEINSAAGVEIARDDEGWKVLNREPDPGQPPVIQTGTGPDGLAAAQDVRDRIAVAKIREQQAERQEQQAKEAETAVSEAVIGTQTGEIVPAPKQRNERQEEARQEGQVLTPLAESQGTGQSAPLAIGQAPEDAPAERQSIQNELDTLTGDILPGMDRVFSGVEIVDSIPGLKTGGFARNRETGQLTVVLNDAREAIGKVTDKKKWASAAIIEEAIHATVNRLENEGRIDASSLLDSIKADAPKVYEKFRKAFKTNSDAVAASEFMRMLVQGRASFKVGEGLILDGELTEMQFTPRILRELSRVLKQVLAVIRDLQSSVPKELAAELEEARILVENTLRDLTDISPEQQTPSGGATAEGGDSAVSREPDGGIGQSVVSDLPQSAPRPGKVKSENEGVYLAEPKVWAAKNAATDAQRVRMGLKPRMAVMSRKWGAVWSQAMQLIEAADAQGRNLANEIVEEFNNSSRILEDWEIAILTHQLVVRETVYEDAKRKMTEAKTATARNEIAAKLDQHQVENDTLFNAIQETGTRTARALAIRKLLIDDRWDIVKMRSDLVAYNGGQPLTPEQSQQVEAAHQKIVDAQQKQEAAKEEELNAKVKDSMEAFFRDIKKAVKGGEKKKGAIRAALKQQAAEARQRLDEARQKLGAGSQIFDPKWYRDSVIVLANELVELGGKVVDAVKIIADLFGEEVTPEEASRMKADADALVDSLGITASTTAKAKGKLKAQQDIEALDGEGLPSKKLVYDSVTMKVREGMDDPQAIMEAVTAELQGAWTELTERQVKEIFTDYGRTTFPDKDEIKRTVRELNVLVTQILHIERMQAGEPPLKKGYQRDKPTQQIRSLYKRVSELKKRLGMNQRTDAQIASALDAAKTRLRNEIEDLEAWLAQPSGRTDTQKQARSGIEYDTEATDLKKRRDELKEALEKLEGPTPLTFAQIVDKTLKALNKTEESLTRRLESGDFASRKKAGAPVLTPEIEEKTSYIQTLREAIQEGRDALTEKKSPEEIALERAEKSLSYWLGILDGTKQPKEQTRKEALSQAEEDALLQIQAIQQVIREEKSEATRISEAEKRIAAAENELKRLERVMDGTEEPRTATQKEALSQKEEDLKLEIAAMKRQLASEKSELTRLSDEQKRVNALQKRLETMQGILRGESSPKKSVKKGPSSEREGYLMAEIQDVSEAIKADRKAREGDKTALGKEKAAAAAYLRARDEYARRVREGDVMPKKKTEPTRTWTRPETAAAYTAMQEARQQYLDLRLDRQAEINLATDKINAKRRIEKLQEKIRNKDFVVKSKATRVKDAELLKLYHEEWKAKREWLEGVFEIKLENRTAFQKGWDGTVNLFGFARSIMTSWDLSAIGRQGGFMLLKRPIQTVQAIPLMLKAAFSEAFYIKHERDLTDPEVRPNAPLYLRDKLSLSSPYSKGPSLDQLEEDFRTRWLTNPPKLVKIITELPVAKQLLSVVKGSNRAYSAALNELRVNAYDAMSHGLSITGMATEAEGHQIAKNINIWTGRSTFGDSTKSLAKVESGLTALGSLLFAPRWLASRFQTLWGPVDLAYKYLDHLSGGKLRRGKDDTKRVDKMAAWELARYLGGVAAIIITYKLFTLDDDDDDKDFIEFDPRSSLFLKLKFGRTYLDPFSGLAQIITFVSRLLLGEQKTPFGVIKEANRASTLMYFLRSKLSPAVGAVVNLLAEKDVRLEETSLGTESRRMLVPMSFGDLWETILTQEGSPRTMLLMLASIAGLSVQNFEADEREKIENSDYNFLYNKGIEIPRLTLKRRDEIAGFTEKDKESVWAQKITKDERKKILEATLPRVNEAVKEIRDSFKEAPSDPDELMEFVKDQQKYFNETVKNAREEAISEIVKE